MHKPALLKEVLEILNPQPGEIYIDATVNGGGHAGEILKMVGSKGGVLGIDWDCDLIRRLRIKSEEAKIRNLKLVCDNYVHIRSIAGKYNLGKIDGVIFDLGFSSYHLEKSCRGFSFLKDEPLDMRYNPDANELTAEKIINQWPAKTIESILRNYGEERWAERIALGIIEARNYKRISSTTELVKVVSRSIPYRYSRITPRGSSRGHPRAKLHPATRTFQALRITVNNELENMQIAMSEAVEILTPSGKIAVITFHSLEDRIVKKFFLEKKKQGILSILTPKPITPQKIELFHNIRARSAKLRAAQKIL